MGHRDALVWCVVLRSQELQLLDIQRLLNFNMVFKISFGRTFSDRHRGPRNLMSFHGYAVSTNQDELVSRTPLKKSWIRL